MATHAENIENLETAVYGEEVRTSMIELFEEDYTLVSQGIGVGTDITSSSSSTTGYSDGNVYINTDTLDIWKLEDSAWANKGNLMGIDEINYTASTADDGYNTLEIVLTDGTSESFQIKNGSQGSTGNGIASIALYSTSGAVKTYRITYTDGTYFDFDVTDGSGATAEEITYDNTSSGLTATDVQAAIDEVNDKSGVTSFNSRTGAISPTASDYDADMVDYDNSTSGLSATDVQAAIDEVVDEKLNSDIVSDVWDSSTEYAADDYCIYNNVLWKCLTANTATTPTEGDYWTATTVGEELTSLNSDLTTINTITITDVTNSYYTISSSIENGYYIGKIGYLNLQINCTTPSTSNYIDIATMSVTANSAVNINIAPLVTVETSNVASVNLKITGNKIQALYGTTSQNAYRAQVMFFLT